MNYRFDIDGLRAIAVLLVVLFHADLNWVSGGFIGVDVFFVISGFLITRIIVDELNAGKFSIASFYARRAKRILPPLILTVLVTLLLGFLLLTPGDYLDLAKSAGAAVLSISNVFFMLNTGYFDQAADLMPLLHTWSLGVEEQFYIIWPIGLLLFFKSKLNKLVNIYWLISLVIVLSFAAIFIHIQTNPKLAFYLPQYRAWEFAVGSAISLSGMAFAGLFAQISKAVGLLLIFASAIMLEKNSVFPGWNAIAPVAGTALLLIPTAGSTLVERTLSLSWVRFIGRVSYSWYLWHWPVIVFWRHYTSGSTIQPSDMVAAIAVSFIIAVLSWRWVEEPFRRTQASRRKIFSVSAIASVGVIALGLSIYAQNGLPGRIPSSYHELRSRDVMWDWTCPQTVNAKGGWWGMCAVGARWETAGSRAMIWGDSHAEHLMPLLDEVGRRHNTAILLFRACPAIIGQDGLEREYAGVPDYLSHCLSTREMAFAMLKEDNRIENVILSSYWPGIVGNLRDAANAPSGANQFELLQKGLRGLRAKLSEMGVRMSVIGAVPHFPRDPLPCVVTDGGTFPYRRCDQGYDSVNYTDHQAKVDEALRSLHGEKGMSVLLVADALCAGSRCNASVAGDFLYRDSNHLRRNMKPETIRLLVERIHLNDVITSRGNANSPSQAATEAIQRKITP